MTASQSRERRGVESYAHNTCAVPSGYSILYYAYYIAIVAIMLIEQMQKNAFILFGTLLLFIVAAYFLFRPEGGRSGSPRGFLAYAPVFSAEERLGTKEISEGQRKRALYVKKELLAEARSQTAFSTEEKAAIGKLMLTEAHLYDFSEEERDAVFSALRR